MIMYSKKLKATKINVIFTIFFLLIYVIQKCQGVENNYFHLVLSINIVNLFLSIITEL